MDEPEISLILIKVTDVASNSTPQVDSNRESVRLALDFTGKTDRRNSTNVLPA